MNFNNFTIKSQEAVQEAVNLVQSRGQQAIEPEQTSFSRNWASTANKSKRYSTGRLLLCRRYREANPT